MPIESQTQALCPTDDVTRNPVDAHSLQSTLPGIGELTGEGDSQRKLIPREIIQAEANLLHFPFFALHTRGLNDRKGIEVTGRKNDHTFRLRITRDTDSCYPGPLARKLHFALLSILFDPQQSSFPVENPIRFTWRELAHRAGLKWSGSRTINRLKAAIDSTHGVVIRTNHALICRIGHEKKPLPKSQRGYHLYEKYTFTNDVLPDGSLADRNYLWLADWYLANLNSLYSGPLKYNLWRQLNDERPIASRIYEYLLFKFTASIPKLIINYETLAPFLPVRVEPRPGLAKQQLNPAFELLQEEQVIDGFTWTQSRDGKIQLHIRPGPQLRRSYPQTSRPLANARSDHDLDDITIRELPLSESPSERLVRAFHRLWSGNANHRPSKTELAYADELIGEYGFDELHEALKALVNRMKTGFKDAKTFGAARHYFPELLQQRQHDQLRRERERVEHEQLRIEEREQQDRKSQRAERRQTLLVAWNKLSIAEQKQIQDHTLDAIPYRTLRTILGKRGLADPPNEVLNHLASLRNLPPVFP